MKMEQMYWTKEKGWSQEPGQNGLNPQLVMGFGGRELVEHREQLDTIQEAFPDAKILFGSTSGEIVGTRVLDDTITVTAIEFEHTPIQTETVVVGDHANSFDVGKELAEKIDNDQLTHAFILSDGLKINGTDLVNGAKSVLPDSVNITGGLAGDAANFEKTAVYLGNETSSDEVAIIGFYGDHIHIGFGSESGWQPFGPLRKITKSESNVLYELDGESALDLYKTYLGDKASELPGSGLLFPLNIKGSDEKDDRIRTLLAVDEDVSSMTFAGDIPKDAKAQFMRASTQELVDGAIHAAENANIGDPDLAILVSCVGRKLVMKQRVEEEVEGVQSILGPDTVMTGFYSYGEICPSSKDNFSALHNQTMTITTFKED